MKAKPMLREKRLVEGGGRIGVAELAVWEVPRSGDYPTGHHKPKGPHLHLEGQEVPYAFTTLEQLIDDFWDLVRKAGFTP